MTPPDSGDHCGDRNCHIPVHRKPDSGEREVCLNPNCEVCAVSLPHDLAQRILAALEWRGQWRQRNELAAELRAIVERKT